MVSKFRRTGGSNRGNEAVKRKLMKPIFPIITLRMASVLVLTLVLFGFSQSPVANALEKQGLHSKDRTSPKEGTFQALVVYSSRNDLSPYLRDIRARAATISPGETEGIEIPNHVLPKAVPSENGNSGNDQILRDFPLAPTFVPAPLSSFDGVSNYFGGWPPDTQGEIGTDHYVQWINLHFAVWRIDKLLNTANLIYGPVPGNSLFQDFGGACEETNNGDPITLYDSFSQRWFMGQFALPNWPSGPFYECIAVSQTPDPLGAWYRYEFQMPVDKMNDYPKFGVWPDAYYMTVNQFNGGSMAWGGAGVAALERSAMLNGSPARMVYFDLYGVNSQYGGMLPADFDGTFSPPLESPGYFLEWDDASMIPSQDAIRLWQFHVDWNDPGSSSFGVAGNPNLIIPTDNVDPDLCGYSRNCIPQPGTGTKVDAISDRLMYRLQYRNFGSYETLLTNHTVDVNGADRAGIHWFELRKPDGSGPLGWSIYQQGVYSPDADHRWMGSIAMDHGGNIALGYSVSSSSTYPSVRYSGRQATDIPGSLSSDEQSLVAGSGSQTGSSRWGDYSMMAVDPVDDCTFWYTQQYVATTGYNTWKTRIGSFRFPNCSIGFRGTLQGTVRDSSTLKGIDGAQVRATADITHTYPTITSDGGNYSMLIPVDIYEVTASKYGYLPSTITGIEVFSGTVTNQDFSLSIASYHTISGTVKDAETGWPLYAQITIDGAPIDPIWSNPITGFYSVSLPEGIPFNFLVRANLPGYLQANLPVGPVTGDLTQDVALQADGEACTAPGYQLNIVPTYTKDFEPNNGGFTASGVTSWAWGEPTSGPGAAHSGVKVWATNLSGNYSPNEDGYITSPVIDLSAYLSQTPALNWWQWLETEAGFDKATVEASKDGGNTWIPVYGPVSGAVDKSWEKRHVFLDSSYAVDNFQMRFHFTSDVTVNFPGWYVDDLTIGPGDCEPQEGGLVAGNVFDANTSQGLVGAMVTSDGGLVTTSQETPLDPAIPDGFYTLFSTTGSHTFTSTLPGGYRGGVESVLVPTNGTVRRDFSLQAGWLAIDPSLLEATLEMGDSITQTLTITNQGGVSATFELIELEQGSAPLGPFETPSFAVKTFKSNLPYSQGLGIPAPPVGAPLSAGEVILSWAPQGALAPWGISFDGIDGTVWVSSPAASWGGEDKLYEFNTDGAATGRFYPHTSPHDFGPADLAFNWKTGMMWIMNVNSGEANCIYEIDPRSGYTGASICPGGESGFSLSQRGLAYDPYTDTWFAGGWNELMVYRFDSAGNILSSVQTGLSIAGLAFNPETQHLFVMVNGSPNHVYVLDVANAYNLIGEFSVSQDFSTGAGAGMEFDCSGNLWAVDMITDKVYQFSSGETANLCVYDVPWLSEDPVSDDIDPINHQLVEVTYDAGIAEIDQPGIFHAQLMVKENTPYSFPHLPVTMTVTAPSTWGKLKGVVTGMGYCGANPEPLEGAEVFIESSAGLTWTLTTDISGYYQRWLDQSGSPYTITISATEQTLEQVGGITVSGGVTVTQDVFLHWLQPCVTVDPEQWEVEIKTGRTKIVSITLDNQGYAGSNFEFQEIPPYGDVSWLSLYPISGTLPAQTSDLPVQATFDASVPEVVDPGEYYASLLLSSDDPVQVGITIPVTMTVLALDYGVGISGDMTSHDIPGETVTYTMRVTNTGEGPIDTVSLSFGTHSWSTVAHPSVIGPLDMGESAFLNVAVGIPGSAVGGEYESVEVLAASVGDPSKIATATLTTTVDIPLADMEVNKISLTDPVFAGFPLTYSVTITNHGPTKAPRVTLMDVLPPGVTYLGATSSSGEASCTLVDYVVICQPGTFTIGESRSIFIAVKPIILGNLTNRVFVVANPDDPNPDNNWDILKTLVEGFLVYFPYVPR